MMLPFPLCCSARFQQQVQAFVLVRWRFSGARPHRRLTTTALYSPVVKQLRCIVACGKFAERIIRPRGVPRRRDRSLAARRAEMLRESLAEIERPGSALGSQYYPGTDIDMIANFSSEQFANLKFEIRLNPFPGGWYSFCRKDPESQGCDTSQGAADSPVDNPSEST